MQSAPIRDISGPEKLRISEIFCSIQGEGKNIGTPAVFLRTALCNLKCTWCDTKYTWDWENYDYKKEVKELELSTICKTILAFKLRHLVVTGGEPLIQQKGLELLLGMLKNNGCFIEVETNGTVLPGFQIEDLVDRWNVSPKLSSSENNIFNSSLDEICHYFSNNNKTTFKFVISNFGELKEVEKFVGKYSVANEKICLMPQCRTREEFFEKSGWISEYCIKNQFRFSPRLQVLLWSNQRGR